MSERKYLSLAELDNLGESEDQLRGFNPYGDANHLLPLIPAGAYTVRVEFVESRLEWRWNRHSRMTRSNRAASGKTAFRFVTANVNVFIHDGDLEGQGFPWYLSTCPRKKMNSTKVEFAFAIGLECPAADPLGAGPWTCQASVDWKAEYWDPRLRRVAFSLEGMGRFPRDSQGTPIPEVKAPNGETVFAKNYVRCWKPLHAQRDQGKGHVVTEGMLEKGAGNEQSNPLNQRERTRGDLK